MSFSGIAAAYPWPAQRAYPNQILHTYDGGGRELIIDLLRRRSAPVVLEVGAFLGGSALQWLQVPDAKVICLDPWEGAWWVSHAREHGWAELEQRFAEPDGPFKCFQANLWEHRDRVTAVKGYAPAKLYELHSLGLRPDIVYFDSDKSGSGMGEAARLFPDAVICGDDWTWGHEDGYPIRTPVRSLARHTSRKIVVRKATWILQKSTLTLRQRADFAISLLKDALRPIRARLS